MNKQRFIAAQRLRRQFRVRNRLRGDAQKPRLCVQRTHQHIACQLIDDQNNETLVSASSRDQNLRESIRYGGNCAAAQAVGQVLAQRALAAGIQTVRFDRGSYKYHGRVAALAQAAREAGLKFSAPLQIVSPQSLRNDESLTNSDDWGPRVPQHGVAKRGQ